MRSFLPLALLGAACLLSQAASAQTSQPSARAPVASAQKVPPTKSPAAAPKAAESSGGGGENQLRQRVEQLEEQLVDLQVALGTLESLGRAGPAATGAPRGAASGGLSGPEAGRIAALETQVQALTVQVEQMTEQMRGQRGAPGPAPASGTYRSMSNAPAAAAAGGGFGTATVTPGGSVGGNDPIGQLITTPEPRQSVAAATPAMASSAGSRQLYEASYNQLLQQNYPAAEAGFTEFLQRFPGDEMAANAQFWLGETFFVRGQWDAAGEAFLKVVKSYGNSVKAPDSLAKLAMSFERKGNKQAACRALAELNTRYPNPPAHVRTWETTERRRAGCV